MLKIDLRQRLCQSLCQKPPNRAKPRFCKEPRAIFFVYGFKIKASRCPSCETQVCVRSANKHSGSAEKRLLTLFAKRTTIRIVEKTFRNEARHFEMRERGMGNNSGYIRNCLQKGDNDFAKRGNDFENSRSGF
jgi:hypothetical protein